MLSNNVTNYQVSQKSVKWFQAHEWIKIHNFPLIWRLACITICTMAQAMTYTVGHKKHTEMCFAITFVNLDGF